MSDDGRIWVLGAASLLVAFAAARQHGGRAVRLSASGLSRTPAPPICSPGDRMLLLSFSTLARLELVLVYHIEQHEDLERTGFAFEPDEIENTVLVRQVRSKIVRRLYNHGLFIDIPLEFEAAACLTSAQSAAVVSVIGQYLENREEKDEDSDPTGREELLAIVRQLGETHWG